MIAELEPSVEDLSAYFDGAADQVQAATIAGHVSSCERCQRTLGVWRAAQVRILAQPKSSSRRIGLVAASVLLVLAFGGLTVLAATGAFRVLRILEWPFVAVGTPLVETFVAEAVSADVARARTGLPIADSGLQPYELAEVRLLSDGSRSIQLVYAGASRGLLVSVVPLASGPGVSARGFPSKMATVRGQPVLLLFGDPGPFGPVPTTAPLPTGKRLPSNVPVPSTAVIDADALAHRLTAVFEFQNSAVFIWGDDRELSEAAMLGLVERWLGAAH